MENEDIFDDITNELDRMGIETRVPVVHAIFVKDHSGSMGQNTPDGGQKRWELAMSNFNEQLVKIKRESDEVKTTVTIVEFDDRVMVDSHMLSEIQNGPASRDFSYDVRDVAELKSWWVGGSTALRDAIGAAVQLGSVLMSNNADIEDQSVLVMILTDGEENNSVEWSDEMIKSKIKELEDSGKWTFTFMGGQLQASDMITKMGFSRGNTMSMSQTTASYSSSAKMSSDGLDKYYTMRKTGLKGTKEFFTEEEEDKRWQQKRRESI